jgi:hypothetical protein
MSTFQPLFQFIKDRYIVTENLISVQKFYKEYTDYCDGHHISPLSKVVVARTLSNELDITSIRPYVDGKCIRVYSISRKDLYKTDESTSRELRFLKNLHQIPKLSTNS